MFVIRFFFYVSFNVFDTFDVDVKPLTDRLSVLLCLLSAPAGQC